MTSFEFIQFIRNEYLRAREVVIKDLKIKRGTNHSISSLSEDIFGKYISDLVSENYEIWIDPQITIKNVRNTSGRKSKLFRPDVCVYNKLYKRVDILYDLKMDLGYKRNEFIEYAKKRTKELNEIKINKGTWKNIEFDFNEETKWNYIILSEGNITKKQMDFIKEYFSNNIDSNLFILSSGEHLNTSTINPQFKINENSFHDIVENVKKVCG